MRVIFISNTKQINGVIIQHSIEECVCTKDWSGNSMVTAIKDSFNNLEDLVLETATEDDVVFVIDVHCTFSKLDGDKNTKVENHQDQGGVVIYRHLLKALDQLQPGAHGKLKVVFYSPIEQARLVSLKPENYVLNELPFVRARFDGNFGSELSKVINSYNSLYASKVWPRFSNASENLLSGWALANKINIKTGGTLEKIDLRENKPIVIDDEWNDWQITLENILSETPDYFLDPLAGDDLKQEFRKLKTNDFKHIKSDTFDNYHLIISDLYLHERHETDRFKTNEFVKSISGFQLFQKIRAADVEPAIPVIFHTTSTKFRISELLRAFGAAGQVTKNNNYRASAGEKLDVYLALKENLEGITDEYSSSWRRTIYDRLPQMSATSYLKNVTKTPASDKAISEVKGLLKNLLVAVGQRPGLDESYIDSYFENFEVNPLSFGAVSMIRSVGLIPETLNKLGKKQVQTPELAFALHLRHHASHAANYRLFAPFDAELITILVVKSLMESGQRRITESFPDKGDFWNNEELTHPVFDYIHYYNLWLSYVPDRFKKEENDMNVKKRVEVLARHYASSGKWEMLSEGYKKELAGKPNFSIQIGNFPEPFSFDGNRCSLQLPS